MIRFVLALCALLFLVPVAQAASFDCAKAATSFEKAVCASPELSKRDETLAKAYATALGGLSSPAAAQVKAGQHDWLDYAARLCSDDAQPIAGAYTADQTQCLVGEFGNRIAEFEASKMQGGYRFYPVELRLIERDPDATADSYNKVATKHFTTVKIDGDDDVAAAFNALTEKLRADDDFSIGENTTLFAKGSDKLATGDTFTDVDLTTTVSSVSSQRITLSTEYYWYGHGAAHGNYAISYTHFLTGEKRELVASDIFAGDDWQKSFGDMVVAATKDQLGDDYQGSDDADVAASAIDPSRWDFSDGGLTVQFEPYEVASYAAGAVRVTVPWTELGDMLAERAMEIAVY
jgi:uncharacterized protein YecT (DUF1311 family)